MDFSTVLGFIAGLSLIIISIILGEGGGLALYMDTHGLMIVLGGVMAATFVSYPMNEVIGVFKIVGKVFRHDSQDPTLLMIELMQIATKVKREGLIKLPSFVERLDDPFIQKGAQMVSDRFNRGEIIRTLDNEILITMTRHKVGREMFAQMGKYAPAFGMVGTLIGLVQMMANLKDPDKVGPAMGIALLATFYGAVSANLFFLPISSKLKRRSEQEFLSMQIIKEALLSIEAGESMTLMEDKLSSFVSRSLYSFLTEQRKNNLSREPNEP